MTFTGPLDTSPAAAESQLVVTDPMHEFISAPKATISGATLSVVLSPTMLMDGLYTVSYRAWAQDGVASQGSWYFHVDGSLIDEMNPPPATAPIPASGSTSLQFMAKGSGIPDHEGSSQGIAMGTLDIDFSTATMCYRITTRGLDAITAGHIHSASNAGMSISEEISLPIDLAAINATAPVCSHPSPQSLAYLAKDPSRYVLMLHTMAYPDGAVAGPFLLVSSTASGSSIEPPRSMWMAIILAQVAALLAAGALLVMARRRRAPRPTAAAGSARSSLLDAAHAPGRRVDDNRFSRE